MRRTRVAVIAVAVITGGVAWALPPKSGGPRGTLSVGGFADMMIFDAEDIGPSRKAFVHDLPGGVGRYKAFGRGVHATFVNGVPIVLEGELTGRLPGRIVSPA